MAWRWTQRAAQSLACGEASPGCCGPKRVEARSELRALPAPSSRLSAHKAAPPANRGARWAHGRPGTGWSTGLFPSCICNPCASILPEWRGFSISALSAQPSAPAQPPSRPGSPPHGGGGLRGLGGTGRVHPPAWRLGPRLRGDAVSGSRAAFKKLNTIFGNPPVGILPLHTRHNTHSPPLFHSFLPRFLLLPLLPPTFQPIILPPTRERGPEEKMKCLFLCPNLWALSGPAMSDRPVLRS